MQSLDSPHKEARELGALVSAMRHKIRDQNVTGVFTGVLVVLTQWITALGDLNPRPSDSCMSTLPWPRVWSWRLQLSKMQIFHT